jgi:hypothetical protein
VNQRKIKPSAVLPESSKNTLACHQRNARKAIQGNNHRSSAEPVDAVGSVHCIDDSHNAKKRNRYLRKAKTDIAQAEHISKVG